MDIISRYIPQHGNVSRTIGERAEPAGDGAAEPGASRLGYAGQRIHGFFEHVTGVSSDLVRNRYPDLVEATEK